ncbi:MAG: hypothetical protein AAFZ65_08065, partial [Planctomycetota bacterium]
MSTAPEQARHQSGPSREGPPAGGGARDGEGLRSERPRVASPASEHSDLVEAAAALAELIGERELPTLLRSLLPALVAEGGPNADPERFARQAAERIGALAARSGDRGALRTWAARAAQRPARSIPIPVAEPAEPFDALAVEWRVLEGLRAGLVEVRQRLDPELREALAGFLSEVEQRLWSGLNSQRLFQSHSSPRVRTYSARCSWNKRWEFSPL